MLGNFPKHEVDPKSAYFDIFLHFVILGRYFANRALLLILTKPLLPEQNRWAVQQDRAAFICKKICLSAKQTIPAKWRQTQAIFPVCELWFFSPVGWASGKIVYSRVALIAGPEYFWIYHFYCLLYWITVKEKILFVRIQNQNTLRAFRIHLQDIKKGLRKKNNSVLLSNARYHPHWERAPSQKGRCYQIFMLTFREKG